MAIPFDWAATTLAQATVRDTRISSRVNRAAILMRRAVVAFTVLLTNQPCERSGFGFGARDSNSVAISRRTGNMLIEHDLPVDLQL